MISTDITKKSRYKTTVALGCFDGVHLGHQAVIKAAVNSSQKRICPTVFTFSNLLLPTKVRVDKIESISLPGEKKDIILGLGIKQIYEVRFYDVSFMDGEEFVRTVLDYTLKAKKVFCGFNYCFGKDAICTAQELKSICAKYKIETEIIPPVIYDEKPISSTRIKNCIKNGEMTFVKEMLGRYFNLNFTVVKGTKLGSYMKTPTINQMLPPNLIVPKFGSYASIVTIDGKRFCGATNIGIRPTLGANVPLAETWMPDYNGGALYDKRVKVELVKFMRDEQKFDSIGDLKFAIMITAAKAKKIVKPLL